MTDSEKLDLLLVKAGKLDSVLVKAEKLDLLLERAEKIDLVLDKTEKLEKDVTDMKLTLENEIRTNIMRIAEGHLDLSRQFEKTIKLDNEKEMLSIRVSILETEMRKMRQQLSQTAL